MAMIFGAVAKAVLPMVVKAAIEKATDKQTAAKIEAVVAADPKAVNELSAEPIYQSRVVLGSVVSALGVVVPLVAKVVGYDVDGSYVVEVGCAVLTLWGAGYALYGRLWTGGLKPLFSRG